MIAFQVIKKTGGNLQMQDGRWTRYTKRHYECRVYLCREETGGFSAYLPTLPGVVSEGDTQDEALRNIEEACRGTLKAYGDAGEKVPWAQETEDRPADAKELRILVDA